MKQFFRTLFTAKQKLTVNQIIVKRTTWSFMVFGVMIILAMVGWNVLKNQPLDEGNRGIQKPIRSVLQTNEQIFDGLISDNHLAKTYPKERAVDKARINGRLGLRSDLDSSWQLQVIKLNGDTLHISLDEINALPKTEYAFDFKCIEGWSEISHWGGLQFSTFVEHYGLTEEIKKQYAGLSTPDHKYYVGIDMASMLHPQTLLCYENNGKALTPAHGYPLRLLIPVKYGVKSLKRIGTIYFSDERPPDYWAERGYDYFIGL